MPHGPTTLLAKVLFLGSAFSTACEPVEVPPSVAAIPVASEDDGHVRTGEKYEGIMSWYSVKTNGGTRTASGEKFCDHGNTAAHRTLPFGTLVEVTNLVNDRTEILRITDRGPFKKERVIDVSIGAAKKLGFDKAGLAKCRVEVVQKREEATPVEGNPEPGEVKPEEAKAEEGLVATLDAGDAAASLETEGGE